MNIRENLGILSARGAASVAARADSILGALSSLQPKQPSSFSIVRSLLKTLRVRTSR